MLPSPTRLNPALISCFTSWTLTLKTFFLECPCGCHQKFAKVLRVPVPCLTCGSNLIMCCYRHYTLNYHPPLSHSPCSSKGIIVDVTLHGDFDSQITVLGSLSKSTHINKLWVFKMGSEAREHTAARFMQTQHLSTWCPE